MSTREKRGIGRLLAAILLLSCLSCSEKDSADNRRFDSLVAAHTSGAISREGRIRVLFTSDVVSDSLAGRPLDEPPLEFDPSIDGQSVWIDRRTLEFRPASSLPPGRGYVATLPLTGPIPGIEDPGDFRFEFSVMPQSFEVVVDGLRASSRDSSRLQELTGRVLLADVEDNLLVEQLVSVVW